MHGSAQRVCEFIVVGYNAIMNTQESDRIDIDPKILIEGLHQYTKTLHAELNDAMHENIKLRAVITQLTAKNTEEVKTDD